MAKTVRIEKRQRGVFGWVFLVIFWAFNAFMALSMFLGLANTGDMMGKATTEAEKAGTAIGTALGVGMMLSMWMAGAVILGLFVFLTRGKKVITETVTE